MKLIIPALLLLCASVSAQTATELFNPAAREYIYGNNSVASNLVTEALEQYPTDEKLQKLKELIEQQQQDQQNQQNQDQQNQQNQDQQNQDQNQQNQDQQNQNQQNQNDQQKQDQQNQQDQSDQQQDQQNQDQQNQQDQDQQQEPQEAQPSQAQPHQAGEMSEEEAQQLLDAMKQNEKDQRLDLQPYLGAPVRVDKDW